jgi:hypothetical protein
MADFKGGLVAQFAINEIEEETVSDVTAKILREQCGHVLIVARGDAGHMR